MPKPSIETCKKSFKSAQPFYVEPLKVVQKIHSNHNRPRGVRPIVYIDKIVINIFE